MGIFDLCIFIWCHRYHGLVEGEVMIPSAWDFQNEPRG